MYLFNYKDQHTLIIIILVLESIKPPNYDGILIDLKHTSKRNCGWISGALASFVDSWNQLLYYCMCTLFFYEFVSFVCLRLSQKLLCGAFKLLCFVKPNRRISECWRHRLFQIESERFPAHHKADRILLWCSRTSLKWPCRPLGTRLFLFLHL